MAFYDTPITKLDAVNICLNSIGESSISTLEGQLPPDAQIAYDLVDEQSRQVQNIGWHWNRETRTLTPDINKWIQLPSNISRVRSINGSRTADVIQRGHRLYDRLNNTFEFDVGTQMEVEVYILLPFDELVQQAKECVAYRAAMIFQQRVQANGDVDKFLRDNAGTAWRQLIRAEHAVGRPNMLRDNWSSASVLNRGMFSRGMY